MFRNDRVCFTAGPIEADCAAQLLDANSISYERFWAGGAWRFICRLSNMDDGDMVAEIASEFADDGSVTILKGEDNE